MSSPLQACNWTEGQKHCCFLFTYNIRIFNNGTLLSFAGLPSLANKRTMLMRAMKQCTYTLQEIKHYYYYYHNVLLYCAALSFFHFPVVLEPGSTYKSCWSKFSDIRVRKSLPFSKCYPKAWKKFIKILKSLCLHNWHLLQYKNVPWEPGKNILLKLCQLRNRSFLPNDPALWLTITNLVQNICECSWQYKSDLPSIFIL